MDTTLDIAAIRLGERHRKNMGDLTSLARSIADVCLLHPVVVTPDGRLIAGERRLRQAFSNQTNGAAPVALQPYAQRQRWVGRKV